MFIPSITLQNITPKCDNTKIIIILIDLLWIFIFFARIMLCKTSQNTICIQNMYKAQQLNAVHAFTYIMYLLCQKKLKRLELVFFK